MRFACRITKATNAHTEYVILTALPLREWLRERYTLYVIRNLSCLLPFVICYLSIYLALLCQKAQNFDNRYFTLFSYSEFIMSE